MRSKFKRPGYEQIAAGVPEERFLDSKGKNEVYGHFLSGLLKPETQRVLKELELHEEEVSDEQLQRAFDSKVSLKEVNDAMADFREATTHVRRLTYDGEQVIKGRGHVSHHFGNFAGGKLNYLELVKNMRE